MNKLWIRLESNHDYKMQTIIHYQFPIEKHLKVIQFTDEMPLYVDKNR
jgi:hypothetical protein